MTKQAAEPGSTQKNKNASNNRAKQRDRPSNQSRGAVMRKTEPNLRGVSDRRRGCGAAGR